MTTRPVNRMELNSHLLLLPVNRALSLQESHAINSGCV